MRPQWHSVSQKKNEFITAKSFCAPPNVNVLMCLHNEMFYIESRIQDDFRERLKNTQKLKTWLLIIRFMQMANSLYRSFKFVSKKKN